MPRRRRAAADEKKRRAKGTGSVRWREDLQKYEARTVVGYNDKGNARRESEFFDLEREANDWLILKAAERLKGEAVEPNRLTVREFVAQWLEHMEPELVPKAHRTYSDLLRLHVVPFLGEHRLSDLKPLHVQRWQATLRKKDRSPYTIKAAHAKLRQALGQAVDWQLLASNPAARVKLVRAETREAEPWDADETARFLDCPEVRGHRLFAYFHLDLMVGARPSELLGLRWACVDLAGAQLRIERGATQLGGRMVEGNTKNRGSVRVVALSGEDVAVLEAHRERQERERMVAGERWREHDLVFASRVGTTLLTRNVGRAKDALVAAAGVRRITLYEVRHTYGSLADAADVPPKVLSERMGHSTVAFTMSRYVKSFEKRRRLAALPPGEFLERARNGGATSGRNPAGQKAPSAPNLPRGGASDQNAEEDAS